MLPAIEKEPQNSLYKFFQKLFVIKKSFVHLQSQNAGLGERSFTKCELPTFKTIQADVAQLARAADL